LPRDFSHILRGIFSQVDIALCHFETSAVTSGIPRVIDDLNVAYGMLSVLKANELNEIYEQFPTIYCILLDRAIRYQSIPKLKEELEKFNIYTQKLLGQNEKC